MGKIIDTIVHWKDNLNDEDVKQIVDEEIEVIHAVYPSWKDLAETYLQFDETCSKEVRPFVDVDAYAEWLSKNSPDYYELNSGKVINY